MPDLLCLGEILIDFVPTTRGRRLREVAAFKKAPGGAPANVAAGFSRLGGSAALISKTGEDEFGCFLRSTMEKAGVQTTYLYTTTEALTGLAFVSLPADGEPSFIFYRNPAADMLLSPNDITNKMFGHSRIFHFGSVSLIGAPAREATLKAARLASEQGLLVSYDPNLRPALWPELDRARDEILGAMQWADILKLSRSELNFITGSSGDEAVEQLRKRCPRLKLIAVTAGDAGAVLYPGNQRIPIPVYRVNSVDPTGAGDGFVAALLYKINQGFKGAWSCLKWEEHAGFWYNAGLFACAAGTLVTTRHGAIPAMPRRRSVEKYLTDQPLGFKQA